MSNKKNKYFKPQNENKFFLKFQKFKILNHFIQANLFIVL